MALQITLVKAPQGISLPQHNRVFDQRGGSFGRADGNTWVLPDPDKFLSSCHCEIVHISSQFYLVDKSTNGTFVNGGFEPLGRGTRHPLCDGDFFEIGDYRFSVQLEHQAIETHSSPFDFSPAAPSGIPLFEEFPKKDFPLDDTGLFDEQQDPLALWDKRPQSPQPFPFEAGRPHDISDANAVLDDFMGLSQPARSAQFSTMDLSPSMDQAVSWPSASAENLIPEDWADDLVGSTSKIETRGLQVEDNFLSPFSAVATNPMPEALPFDLPKPNARIPLAERIFLMDAPQEKPTATITPPSQEKQQVPKAAMVMPVTAVKPQVQQVDSQSISQVSQMNNNPNRILIDALGLDVSRLSEADMEEISRISGLLIREIVDGMLGVLRSRASIKNEFRMNVTTIQPVENNPLKFSVCVDDALENLFVKKSKAYKKPIEAFREGFQEIAEHQLAMIAGIRQGFEAMMERFNPEQLEKGFSKQVKGSVIPGMQKAKFWISYTDYYQSFTDNMETSFQHLFGSDFVSAYEEQLRRLTAARKLGETNDNS